MPKEIAGWNNQIQPKVVEGEPSYTKDPRYNKNFNRGNYGRFFNDDGSFKKELYKEYFHLLNQQQADLATAAPGGVSDEPATLTDEERKAFLKGTPQVAAPSKPKTYEEYRNGIREKYGREPHINEDEFNEFMSWISKK